MPRLGHIVGPKRGAPAGTRWFKDNRSEGAKPGQKPAEVLPRQPDTTKFGWEHIKGAVNPKQELNGFMVRNSSLTFLTNAFE